jgi:metal-responsive CopG/Arc/MetJ family transcriptional regulator
MKTAISLPDALFYEAERLAATLGLNRSQLFARALKAYIERYDYKAISNRLNQVYADEPASVDKVILEMQIQTLGDEDW